MYREHLHLHLFSICCPWPPSESLWQITSRRSASSQCFLRYHFSRSRKASTGREGKQGDRGPIPPWAPTTVNSQNWNEQTHERRCNCLHLINMVHHHHWSRLGCSGDIYSWTTFQWLSLFIYLVSWLVGEPLLTETETFKACFPHFHVGPVFTSPPLAQCLLLHHWPNGDINRQADLGATWSLSPSVRLLCLLPAVLPGDGGLLAPVPENLGPVYLITALTITIFVYATHDDNEEKVVSFMTRSP